MNSKFYFFRHYVLNLRLLKVEMARIKIPLPEKFLFTTEIKVRIDDINYGGHLGNVSVAGYIHEARFQFFKSLGYKDELSIEGVGTIQADLLINYRAEAFHGDEIKVHIGVQEISKVSFELIYLLEAAENGHEIAVAKTTIVTYDYAQQKKAPVPEKLIQKLTN